MSINKSTREILFSYFSYIILFIGSAFVSGSIVHSGNPSEIGKYAIIGIAGVSLFIAGNFIQEFILNRENLRQEGIVKFFFFSLMLSVGIGMVSGGTQHYSDFPTYSSYLVPLGFIVSLIAYLLKNNYTITKKLWASIIGMVLLVSVPLFFALNALANNMNAQTAKEKAELCAKKPLSFNPFVITAVASVNSGDHGGTACPTESTPHNESNVSNPQTKSNNCPIGQSEKEMPGMCMPDMSMNKNSAIPADSSMSMNNSMNMDRSNAPVVKDDKSFIEYVIPHHQDAVTSSTIILNSTQDPELKTFVTNVIKTQGQEIAALKGYYKTWFGMEYMPNLSYKPMMMLEGLKGLELDKAYIQGMLGHHSGIIDVAKAVLADSKTQYKPEILTLSKQIIKDQEADNVVLNKWLDTKYKSSVITPTTTKTNIQTPAAHNESDGHKD